MYKKYITRKGKRTGPYYYESIRLKNGKIKTIYLGKTPDKEKLAKKLSKLKLEIASLVVKGDSIVVPITNESRIIKDVMALTEMFKEAEIKLEKKLTLPKISLSNIRFPKIELFKLFAKEKQGQRKLEEFIPMPGKNDFKFETVLFVLVSVFYVLGFFYLEGSITGFAISENVASSVNYFPMTMGILNLVLILLIYLDLKK